MFVQRAAVSVIGGIQPGILARCLTPEFMASGLTARLLMTMPPAKVKRWSEAEVSDEIIESVAKSLSGLHSLEFVTDEKSERLRPYVCKLSPEAKQRWVAYYNSWAETQARTEGDLAAAFGKIEAYAARFALLHHVVMTASTTAGRGAVSLASMEAGIGLAMWFASETERIYAMLGENEEETELRKLVETVRRLASRKDGRLRIKDLQNSNSRKYRSSEEAEAALESLVSAGLGRWVASEPTGKGGWTPRFFVPCELPPTSDSSYSCSDDEGPDDDTPWEGPSDSCADPRKPTPGVRASESDASTDETGGYSESSEPPQ